MALIYEAVRARKPDTLKSVPQETLLSSLREFWSEESGASVPDLDILFQAGLLVAESGAHEVDGTLSAWLTQNTSPNAWDTAASFLMGYWQSAPKIDRQLATSLLGRLRDTPALPPYIQDTVLVALGRVFNKTDDAKLRDDIKVVYKSVWDTVDKSSMQPLVKTVLMNVLKIEE
jgi:hypothetical protein